MAPRAKARAASQIGRRLEGATAAPRTKIRAASQIGRRLEAAAQASRALAALPPRAPWDRAGLSPWARTGSAAGMAPQILVEDGLCR